MEMVSKYFKNDESRETLKGIFKDSDQIVYRVHTYKTGAVYKGQWKGGLRHGQGSMQWPDNAKYEGQWEYNQACGYGTFYHADGDVYEGQWQTNKCNGKGVYTNVNGAKYDGDWKEDQ